MLLVPGFGKSGTPSPRVLSRSGRPGKCTYCLLDDCVEGWGIERHWLLVDSLVTFSTGLMYQTLPQWSSFDRRLSPIPSSGLLVSPKSRTDITRGPLILASVWPLETSTEPRSVTVLEVSAGAVLIGGELSGVSLLTLYSEGSGSAKTRNPSYHFNDLFSL